MYLTMSSLRPLGATSDSIGLTNPYLYASTSIERTRSTVSWTAAINDISSPWRFQGPPVGVSYSRSNGVETGPQYGAFARRLQMSPSPRAAERHWHCRIFHIVNVYIVSGPDLRIAADQPSELPHARLQAFAAKRSKLRRQCQYDMSFLANHRGARQDAWHGGRDVVGDPHRGADDARSIKLTRRHKRARLGRDKVFV